jgi:hypothetical protein
MPESPDWTAWVTKAANIKLPGGVVGKTSSVLIVASLSMALIAWTAKLWWVSLIALAFVFTLCFTMLWRLINFADRNPQAALFEGAEFLAHEQLRLGTKEEPILPASASQPPNKVVQLEDTSHSSAGESAESN